MGDDIMQELDSVEVFDETAVTAGRRLAIAREQLTNWQESAYGAKLAYQTNKELGHSAEELAPMIAQFTRARAGVTYLEQQIKRLADEVGATTA